MNATNIMLLILCALCGFCFGRITTTLERIERKLEAPALSASLSASSTTVLVDKGTATAIGPRTLQLREAASFESDSLIGAVLTVPAIGEARFIVDYDRASRTATVAWEWAAQPLPESPEYFVSYAY